ncbi:MAG: hypothetical protein KDA88_22295 [Planctomycetaceae bacterium]|nr:hypothetical protein [Planctomycetaceae bacterium]MCA9031753.1 hypothetical protein [Planctomycetaceae bacterium]MCB9953349.1 hypothetical protein [Planctomycetaceae bacterium]
MNREYSDYQRKVINRFYENREHHDDQRLSELVTNLYLATTEKQKDRHWKSAEEAMTRLGVPDSRVKHVVNSREPTLLAEVVKDLQSGRIGKKKS